jgi:glutamine phosphoribosylpyrophosphate amidotransferase
VRYATTGETSLRNVQPLFADFDFGGFGVAHNGNLTNAYLLRKQLVSAAAFFTRLRTPKSSSILSRFRRKRASSIA